MFEKILIANRGVRAAGAGVRSYAKHVTRTPNCVARVACEGDFAAETTHV
jgi:hypothetical protein